MSERPFSQVAKPLIVAHRGASIEEAENTLEAFDLAVGWARARSSSTSGSRPTGTPS